MADWRRAVVTVTMAAAIMASPLFMPQHMPLTIPLTAHAAGCPERPPCEGCGCKGGPGYRSHATGQCVGYQALAAECGDPPTSRCTFENAPGTGLNRECALRGSTE